MSTTARMRAAAMLAALELGLRYRPKCRHRKSVVADAIGVAMRVVPPPPRPATRRREHRKWYTCQQVARCFGVTSQAVRKWEAQGLLGRAMRTIGGHRRYTHQQVVELRQRLEERGANRGR